MKHFCLSFVLFPILVSPALPCSICGGDYQNRQTLRQEIAGAKLVVVGTLSNARLNPESTSGEGRTDLQIEQIVKGGTLLNGLNALTIPRYFPGDGKAAPRGVFFFDVRDGKLHLIAGRLTRSEHLAAYLRALATLEAAQALPFYMRYLDHPDPDIATDAFVEIARSADADVARAAGSIGPERLRKLLTNPQTPERVGLIAFLLACSGNVRDAELMLDILKKAPEDRQSMRRGLMIGYTVLKPREGWEMTLAVLADPKRGFLDRHATLGVLLFFHNWKPEENRGALLRGMRSAVQAGDLADIAIEELRRWRWWDLTDVVLAQFDRRSHESTIVRRAIVRYALACPQPAAARFVNDLRKHDPDLVADVTDSLEAEKPGKK